jgi:NADPH:quinone reductase-like Zn-dependent oxidoreductase
VSRVVAAAAVLPALTAWEALTDHAAVQAGQRVLVHGGAGGVGAFVIQLATALGASVTATAHTPDVDYVRALGAERVTNTDQESLDTQTGVFDAVIDAVGRDVPETLFAALHRGGRLITLQEPPSQEMADAYGVTALFFIVTAERDRLAQLAAMIDNGKLKVAVAATFPLAEGRAAYESGTVRRPHPGKTVLVVRS